MLMRKNNENVVMLVKQNGAVQNRYVKLKAMSKNY